MSSNTMNFGPEWMRRLSKSNSTGSTDPTVRNSSNLPNITSNNPTMASSSNSGSPSNPTFSYSSVAANSRTNSRRNTLTQIEGVEEELKNSANDVHFVDQLNPFKYPKDFMLSLYKPVGLPLDFEKHEYVTSDECLPPMASIELTEQEKKLLSGSVNSDLTRRIVHHSSGGGHGRGERGAHRVGNSGMGQARGGSSHNKEHFRDDDKLEQELARFSKSIMLRENPSGSNTDEALWSNVTRHTVGSFDSDGVFRFGGEGIGEALESLESLKISDEQLKQDQGSLLKENQDSSLGSLPEAQSSQRLNRAILSLGGGSEGRVGGDRPINIVEVLSKKSENERSFREPFPYGGISPSQSPDHMRIPEGRYPASIHDYHEAVPPHLLRWLYKDPSGNIQGPFSPEDMHEWYEGGFFTPSLLVRREDEPMFEPLGMLIQRVGDDAKPFLVAAFLPSIQRQPLGYGRDTHSLPNTPVADRYMHHQAGPGKAGFDPFGGPYTPAYEQGSFNIRRILERQENWQDGFRPEYRGMDQGNNWNNDHLAHPGNGRNPHQQQQPQMHGGDLGRGGVDPDTIRLMMERQRYIQVLQQRQQMLMHQFQQPYSPPAQQPQSPGFQNELLSKLLPHVGAGQLNDPMLQARALNMNPQLAGWTGSGPINDAEAANLYRQMENPQLRQGWQQDNSGSPIDPRDPSLQNQEQSGEAKALETEPPREIPANSHENNSLPVKEEEATVLPRGDENSREKQLSEDQMPEAVMDQVDDTASIPFDQNVDQSTHATDISNQAETAELPNLARNAPWAKGSSSPDMETNHVSLREIQQIEAQVAESRRIERQEQLHAELAALQHQEKINQEASAAVTAALSGWQNTNAPKKSMLDIQKEEEEALKRQAQSKNTPTGASGKRYADTVTSTGKANEGWVTIVGGKNQTDKPTGTPPLANKPEPANPVKTSTQSQPKPTAADFPPPSAASLAQPRKSYNEYKPSEEFLKWCRASLKDLNGINVDEFVQMLLTFPLNPPPATLEIISESVYASSTTLDGRRFAHEFIKKRKIDAGLLPGRLTEPTKTTDEPEESTVGNQGFKVVTKKKGRKH
ncbi:hypothetical protein K493DRAFT_316136 [Basidiobolus meristosporus CBS 931.73]|uniref:GYF domain-containing protein n=1 Tax=Basidiobolus meristosporus CBS 931.73 TaxID=1314790 RepID=A0A1Y1Y561_9FUNG|nr:hypothetical protein K493DRAFT_316136 [Basidiobolus meristosporus CBS 931.73]|eukprot:ORX93137.1 hypothetical protein K493DRAFT_316136 [Basidiobolus meristosporus CBS 931.73]